jgi:serine/threonine-protein kinase
MSTDDPAVTMTGDAGALPLRPAAGTGEFLPGQLVAGRYRIVNLVGRGGMGLVYRADDLKLGQTVALKFLPPDQAADAAWLDRLLGEVRVARQISHPNVCRVYDVGDVDGRHFLSMEFIEGEDLASLLRRIGRLPEEKALQIARQLCAGLAAAHDRGVVHRDLKPANVMIDERGRARITDFGLAGAAQSFGAAEILQGTPAYMAPEQAAGRDVTARSDIYALGLVLHELFTGRRLSPQERAAAAAGMLSTGTGAIDPLVERVITACLAPGPDARPASALQVAGMLPGGDALAVALAAGETPAPEVVAGAPSLGSLSLPAAAAWVVTAGLLLAAALALSERTGIHRAVAMPYSAAQLALRAEQILQRAGIPTAPVARYGFDFDEGDARELATEYHSPAEWSRLQQELREGSVVPVVFWLRTSDQPLLPTQWAAPSNDPSFGASGEARVMLSPAGRLERIEAIPRTPPQAPPPGWDSVFREAGLDVSRFVEAPVEWRPRVYADTVRQWRSADGAAVRVAAATAGGAVVWFEVIRGDRLPVHLSQPAAGVAERAFLWTIVLFYVIVLIGAGVLARRNLRLGRSDRGGAAKLAKFSFLVGFTSFLFEAQHIADVWEVVVLLDLTGVALLWASLIGVGYLALEPIVRRRWPQRLISWTRVLAGDWRNPMVGRDVLIGTTLGLVMGASALCEAWLVSRTGGEQGVALIDPLTLGGLKGVIATLTGVVLPAFIVSLAVLVFIALVSIVVRRAAIAATAFAVLFTILLCLPQTLSAPVVLLTAVAAAAFTLSLAGVGLLAGITTHVVFFLMVQFPLTADLSTPYFPATLAALTSLLALMAFGAFTAAGGRAAFERILPD